MRLTICALVALVLAGHPGGAEADDVLSSPLLEEVVTAAAYPGLETMEVFLVWESDVIAVSFDLPQSETGILALDVGSGCPCRIVHHHGDQVATYVLPPVTPFPADYEYRSRNAVSGTLISGNVPARGAPEYETTITVVLDGIDFGGGETVSIGPLEVLTGITPR